MKDENLQINEVVQPVKVVQEHNEMHAGPIPSAAELQRYKDVDSSLPERIMKQFEADSDHEREQGRKATVGMLIRKMKKALSKLNNKKH